MPVWDKFSIIKEAREERIMSRVKGKFFMISGFQHIISRKR